MPVERRPHAGPTSYQCLPAAGSHAQENGMWTLCCKPTNGDQHKIQDFADYRARTYNYTVWRITPKPAHGFNVFHDTAGLQVPQGNKLAISWRDIIGFDINVITK